MTLIKLAPIAILHSQAKVDRDKVLRLILVPSPENGKIYDSHFAHFIKTHAQAKVIYKNLKKLHRICTDFVAGNFQPYIDEHTEYQKTMAKNPENLPDAEYEPFGELDVPFNILCDFPLPKEIEQFPELLTLCHNFTRVQKMREEANPMWYATVNDEGENVVLPPSELPEDFVYEQKIIHELKGIEVEYCLDNYNDFYRQAMDIISSYHTANLPDLLERFMDGDWIPPSDDLGYDNAQACAARLLTLFSSSN